MSFFYDFLDSFSIDDLGDKIYCDFVFGKAVKVLANFKIENLGEDKIVLRCKKNRIKILGTKLKILALSKGELEIVGNVEGVIKVWVVH